MEAFEQPVVVVSRCLGFDACRYNGEMIEDRFVKKLAGHVRLVTVCPEVEIGLGTPREPIRIVASDERKQLMQPATGRDLTERMLEYAQPFLETLGEADGFVLKSRSPSCAIKDAKIYAGLDRAPVIGKGGGIFGGLVTEGFSNLAIEDEGRLKNGRIREHFLIKLFTLAKFRTIKKNRTIQDLIQFQARNKYLFMAFDQRKQKELGRLAANPQGKPMEEVYADYGRTLHELLSKPASYGSNINVMHHIMGYFSKQLRAEEKSFFLMMLEKYRHFQVPLSSPLGILKSWIVRFDHPYLQHQTFFEPYPEDLIDMADTGKLGSEAVWR